MNLKIEHINKIKLVNRKKNLGIIDACKLPKNVNNQIKFWYEFEIKQFMDFDNLKIKSTTSNKYSLKCKFEEIKCHIRELFEIEGSIIFEKLGWYTEITDSIEEYNEILILSKYNEAKKQLVDIDQINFDTIKQNYEGLTGEEIKYLNKNKNKMYKKYDFLNK